MLGPHHTGSEALQAKSKEQIAALQADMDRYLEEVQEQLHKEDKAARRWPRSMVAQLAAMLENL
jgi:hypothetical protein